MLGPGNGRSQLSPLPCAQNFFQKSLHQLPWGICDAIFDRGCTIFARHSVKKFFCSWQPLPTETTSRSMFCIVCRPIKHMFFPDTGHVPPGHWTLQCLGQKAAEANCLSSPAPKILFRNRSINSPPLRQKFFHKSLQQMLTM